MQQLSIKPVKTLPQLKLPIDTVLLLGIAMMFVLDLWLTSSFVSAKQITELNPMFRYLFSQFPVFDSMFVFQCVRLSAWVVLWRIDWRYFTELAGLEFVLGVVTIVNNIVVVSSIQ